MTILAIIEHEGNKYEVIQGVTGTIYWQLVK